MNTSSPFERKIRLGSPGLLAKPKNFKGRGGGGGSGSVFVTTGDTTGLGMSTSAWKIFRPAPVYLVSSLARNSPSCKVGSSETGATLAFLVPVALLAEVDVRRTVACGVVGGGLLACGSMAAGGGGAPAGLAMRYTTMARANTPSTVAAIVFFRFSDPRVTTHPSLDRFPVSFAV